MVGDPRGQMVRSYFGGKGGGDFQLRCPQPEWICMNKTYQFRLYPTKKQQATLGEWLALCCEVYNAALQERRDAYRMAGVSLGLAHQCEELPACKQVRPELAQVNSQVLQDAVKRVDLAFAAFFRRCAAGEQPGYPRFRSRLRYDSLTRQAIPQQL